MTANAERKTLARLARPRLPGLAHASITVVAARIERPHWI
jgi:hypothetical protein